MIKAIAAFTVLLGTAAQAAEIEHVHYRCERDVAIDVVYVESSGPDQVVLRAEEHFTILTATPSAQGKRYQNSPVLSDYVWWVEDDRAMLGWFDADKGSEATLFRECRERRLD